MTSSAAVTTTEPYTRTFPVAEDATYHVRVMTYNDEQSLRLGPYALSRPPKLVVGMCVAVHAPSAVRSSHTDATCRPAVQALTSEPSIPTPGAVMVFRINDLGRGPLASAENLMLTAEYNNGEAMAAAALSAA